MEQLVNFETAKLAKEAGFDWTVQNRYRKDGGLNQDLRRRYGEPMNYNDKCFQDEYRQYTSAPTLSELQKWLREVHKIDVEAIASFYIGSIKSSGYFTSINGRHGDKFENYEAALEIGLKNVLKNNLLENLQN